MSRDDHTIAAFRACGLVLRHGIGVRVPTLPSSKRSLTVLKLEANRDADVRLAYQVARGQAAQTVTRQLRPQTLRRACGTILDDPMSAQHPAGLASSMMLILVVDAVVAGVLAGLIANAAGGSGVLIALAAALAGASYLVAWIVLSIGRFQQRGYEPLFPVQQDQR